AVGQLVGEYRVALVVGVFVDLGRGAGGEDHEQADQCSAHGKLRVGRRLKPCTALADRQVRSAGFASGDKLQGPWGHDLHSPQALSVGAGHARERATPLRLRLYSSTTAALIEVAPKVFMGPELWFAGMVC